MDNNLKPYTDQLGREVKISHFPKRIISLVPSQTELLFYLGLDEEIAGITKFCIHPADNVKTKTKVGGTKKFHLDKIRQINPDLIIGNKEETEEQQIKELMKEFPVWMSDIKTLTEAYDMINRVGELVNKNDEAEKLVSEIKLRFDTAIPSKHLKTMYLIWREPYITVGADTFINSMLERCGLYNCFGNRLRYPKITDDDIKAVNPELILLSSEPYPFKEKHIEELKSICPNAKIILADGELFSWYGSRLLKSPVYFNQLLSEIDKC